MSAIAANPALLTNLKELYEAGLIDQEELASERSKLFAERSNPWQPSPFAPASGPVESALVSLAATQVDLVRVLGDIAKSVADGSSRKRTLVEDGVLRPDDQPGLFDFGLKTLPKNPASKKRKLVVPLGTHRCPCCDFVTTKPGPLRVHMNAKHPIMTGGNQSVVSLFLKQLDPEDQAKECQRVKDRARDVDIAFFLSDLIAKAVASSKAVGGWCEKVDGRRHNKGLEHRQARSIAFKAKVLICSYMLIC